MCGVEDEFNKNLATLLVKIFIQRLPQWKHHASDNLGNEVLLSLDKPFVSSTMVIFMSNEL